jgi:hypothetical protein
MLSVFIMVIFDIVQFIPVALKVSFIKIWNSFGLACLGMRREPFRLAILAERSKSGS